MVYLCRHFGLPEVADYWESVVALNTWQQHRIARAGGAEAVRNGYGQALGDSWFCLQGRYQRHPRGTSNSDLPQSPGGGAQLHIHDPKVTADQMEQTLNKEPASVRDGLSEIGSWAYAGRVGCRDVCRCRAGTHRMAAVSRAELVRSRQPDAQAGLGL